MNPKVYSAGVSPCPWAAPHTCDLSHCLEGGHVPYGFQLLCLVAVTPGSHCYPNRAEERESNADTGKFTNHTRFQMEKKGGYPGAKTVVTLKKSLKTLPPWPEDLEIPFAFPLGES